MAQGAKVTFTNKCSYTVWPATLTNNKMPQLSTTGFELASGASNSLNLTSPWSGRFWARTGCSNKNGNFSCTTADCGSGQVACNGESETPPATLVEITLASNNGQDFYDVSTVDGFNVPVSVAPQGGSGPCKPSSCTNNINAVCPSALQVKGSDGSVIACKSACLAFNQPQYCCTGAYSSSCPPTNYSQFFKQQCPNADNFPDDSTTASTFTCSDSPDYAITFCP